MGASEWTAGGLFFLGIIFSVTGYLLVRRDDWTDKNLDVAQQEQKYLRNEISEFKNLVLGNYIRREEVVEHFNKLENKLFTTLDRIEAKVDRKIDK